MTINEFQSEYIINNDERKIRIFGSDFVSKNNNNCKIIVYKKTFDLKEFLDLEDFVKFPINEDKIKKIKVRLLLIKEVTDFSNMFCDCKLLLKFYIPSMSPKKHKHNINNNKFYEPLNKPIYHYEEWFLDFYSSFLNTKVTKEIEGIECIFSKCESLIDISDLSFFNTAKVKSFYNAFNECSSLKSLPDISNWRTDIVTNFRGMFRGCSSLMSLPDISKWNTSNVIDMNSMF